MEFLKKKGKIIHLRAKCRLQDKKQGKRDPFIQTLFTPVEIITTKKLIISPGLLIKRAAVKSAVFFMLFCAMAAVIVCMLWLPPS